MKQFARIERDDNTVETVRVKKGEESFADSRGNRYNAGAWKVRKSLAGDRQEATYLEGMPNPIKLREIDLPSGKVIMRAKVAHPDDFTGIDYEKLHGQPIVRWLTVALQQAQGGLYLQYAQLGVSVLTLLVVAWLGYHYYNHPWK